MSQRYLQYSTQCRLDKADKQTPRAALCLRATSHPLLETPVSRVITSLTPSNPQHEWAPGVPSTNTSHHSQQTIQSCHTLTVPAASTHQHPPKSINHKPNNLTSPKEVCGPAAPAAQHPAPAAPALAAATALAAHVVPSTASGVSGTCIRR